VVIRVAVDGLPAPKGSFRISSRGRGRRPVVRKDSPKTEAWEVAVSWAARMAMRGRTMFVDQPLHVRAIFMLPRPDRDIGVRGLRAAALPVPSVKPDLDKLLRSTLDALESIVYDGDSRIVAIEASKVYAAAGLPGAVIEVWPWGGADRCCTPGPDFNCTRCGGYVE
jgi:Holliday junction resolvase RusA-like endonuclease